MATLFGVDLSSMNEVFGGVAAAAGLGALCYAWGKTTGNSVDRRKIKRLESESSALKGELDRYVERFSKLEHVVADAQDFWVRQPETVDLAQHQTQIRSSIPIITVLNLKGGVGKTTICANLAGYFARQGKRVLLLDFDYQGSLTDTVMSHAGLIEFQFTANKLIEGGHTAGQLRAIAERLTSLTPNLWIYPAFYGFSRAEIQMMFRWLVGKDPEIRYNLHNYLQSPPFQKDADTAFDLVLIDAPPRLLTGVVNALVASTHVLVPTILDGQSHIATLNTLGTIQIVRQKLNHNLKTIGVLPTMVIGSTGYNSREQSFIDELERNIPQFHLDGPLPILRDRPILRREELAKAGGSEIYFLTESDDKKAREIREIFARVGEYLDDHLRWRSPSEEQVIAVPGTQTRGVKNEGKGAAIRV
ncbi:MAG: ParA family protein [Hyphomicrobium sp.]|jgi:chromosome partitioning protein